MFKTTPELAFNAGSGPGMACPLADNMFHQPPADADSRLWNADLAPVPVAGRTWTTLNYVALWVSMAACIPTYMLASSLIEEG